MAVSWYRKAAEQGEASGQYNLGIMYRTGRGVPQDYVQAHMWFNLAASHTYPVDDAVADRDLVAARMTPLQIAEAQRLAREWKSKTDAR
jgi:TPR repeat protein